MRLKCKNAYTREDDNLSYLLCEKANDICGYQYYCTEIEKYKNVDWCDKCKDYEERDDRE